MCITASLSEMRKTNVTIIPSPKMPKKYVLEYEGKNPIESVGQVRVMHSDHSKLPSQTLTIVKVHLI